MPKQKINLTLFQADWCGHCKNFQPHWEDMTKYNKAQKLINFQSYKDTDPETKKRKISGYPTLQYSINGKTHEYNGNRTAKDIYSAILKTLENNNK